MLSSTAYINMHAWMCVYSKTVCSKAKTREQISVFINLLMATQMPNLPSDFIFGTASSAYQYEGAVDKRGKNIWDTFTHKHPEMIMDGSNGDTGCGFSNEKLVNMMSVLGFEAYSFSISWSRILPSGKICGGVNHDGIKYYHGLIDALLKKGIMPLVTLFHWDVPRHLEDEYGGFRCNEIVYHFHEYADLCFKEFGGKVKQWITVNEPWTFCYGGYVVGSLAPGRCSPNQMDENAPHRGYPFTLPIRPQGDSGTEPYLVAHNLLRAHAATVKLYRQKYQACQKGRIGIKLVSAWMVPYTESKSDRDAASRALDFMFGWFMDPLTHGDYPTIMRQLVGFRLPMFSKEESDMLKGSYDFLGLNYYTARYAADDAWPCEPINGLAKMKPSYLTDSRVKLLTHDRRNKPIGPKAGSPWLYYYPNGIFELLHYAKNKYNSPLIYITENGVDDENMREYFYSAHLSRVQKAIECGVNVKGYFVWTLVDCFEWNQGYTAPFGLCSSGHKANGEIILKLSATGFKNMLLTHK